MSPAHAACSASRKTYYQWLAKAEQYGLSALLPKERRTPHQPNAMSMEEVSVILAEAVARPTLGARSLLRHLHARGCTARPREWPGPAPAQLGHCQAARGGLGLLTAADSGQVTDRRDGRPFGFCLFASRPGKWSAWTPSRRPPQGVGAVWQLTAVDVATRIAVVQLIVGDKTAVIAGAFLSHLKRPCATTASPSKGPDRQRTRVHRQDFTTARTALDLIHHRIPPRSPNHNAVCERFHGTVLREFYRPHFHRGRVDDLALLSRSLQAWLNDYNHHRPNHGDYMAGRTPVQARSSCNAGPGTAA